MAESTTFILRYVTGVLGAILAFLSFTILQVLRRHGGEMMASLQEDADATLCDFRLLLAGEVFLLFGLLLYTAGGFFEIGVLTDVTRVIGAGFALLIILVFYRWWRMML